MMQKDQSSISLEYYTDGTQFNRSLVNLSMGSEKDNYRARRQYIGLMFWL